MSNNVKCFMVEMTGRMTDFVDGVSSPYWRRLDTGDEFVHIHQQVGAMYYASVDNQKYYRPGPDGRTLFVVTPGGTWNIDSRASNCGMPQDETHYCWVRHGVPPNVTVNKVGTTCQAGAGSIMMDKYHGFLTNGYLTNCP